MISNFELKGQWFLSSNKDNRVHGSLFYDSNDGIVLELFESFSENQYFSELRTDEIILGVTNDSKQVTLYNCIVTKTGGTTLVVGEEAGIPITKYRINYLLIGVHIYNVDDFKFNTISCEIFNLDEWVGISGFDIKNDRENLEVSVNYKLPSPIEFKIDGTTSGTLAFLAKLPTLFAYQKDISIIQRLVFEAKTNEETSLEELLSYIYKFQTFLILGLYKSTFFTSIKIKGDRHIENYGDKSDRKKIDVYFQTISNNDNSIKPIYYYEMFFSYRSIQDDFPIIIKNWFEKYLLLESSINLLIEQFYNDNLFTTNTFLNLAQAAETFHARIHNHKKIPKDDYKIMKEEILEVVSQKHHKWLNEQFNFGNNLNLHKRLNELVDKYSSKTLDKIIGNKEKFILQVKHSRNYYTHYSKSSEKNALKGKELMFLSKKLQALLVCAILVEAGFTKEKINVLLDNIKWRLNIIQ